VPVGLNVSGPRGTANGVFPHDQWNAWLDTALELFLARPEGSYAAAMALPTPAAGAVDDAAEVITAALRVRSSLGIPWCFARAREAGTHTRARKRVLARIHQTACRT
jgi:hypothetical protein